MTEAELKRKARTVYGRLAKLHPDARIELEFAGPLELLVATILSAQSTDVMVNKITKDLFKKYRAPGDYLKVPPEELENDIRRSGFFRQKAKSIRGAMQAIGERHGGQVPRTMDELVKLPGVGRKTANVLLGNAFGVPGLVTDTHVIRVSRRIGLTTRSEPEKIEADLCRLAPAKDWTQLSHTLIFHGRYTCHARKPDCPACTITDLCDDFRERNG
jgi:endonuclease III